MKELSCAFNKLTALDLTDCWALEEIECQYNQLTALNFAQNKMLTKVDCYSNSIEVNAMQTLVESLPTVSSGELVPVFYNDVNEHNYITEAHALEVLLCHNNRLTSLAVSPQATNLTQVTCHINKLSGAAVDNLIASLPTHTEAWGYLYLLDKRTSANDQNNCTKAQALTASGKHWKVAQYLSDGSVSLIYDPDAIALGDVNGDNELTIADVMAIVDYILGIVPEDFYPEAADMNDDKHITITDATIILSRILDE